MASTQTELGDSRTTVVFTISSENLSNLSAETTKDPHSPQSLTSMNGTRPGEHRRASFDDALPHADYYRSEIDPTLSGKIRKRPTLKELHTLDVELDDTGYTNQHGSFDDVLYSTAQVSQSDAAVSGGKSKSKAKGAVKFGWIQGVLVRCVLNIFGVMLFMRLSWVTAQAGIGLGSLIVILACTVTTITGLSMSAISTNGEVRGGGAYYMISRSLGPEFGGSIGIIFALANAVAAAMYVIGFSETIRDLLKEFDMMPFNDTNAVRIIGLVTVAVLVAITIIGLDWEARTQIFLLVVLTVAIVNVMVGTFIPPTEDKKSKGFLSYQGTLFTENFVPDFRDGFGFFTVFAVFFPAATGILAGANISGDLKDPQKAIPKGTMLAILITTIVYLVMCWMAGLCNLRDACGPMLPSNSTVIDDVTTAMNVTSDNDKLWCDAPKYGIHNDMQVMQLMAGYGRITIAGIISATLSSALASIVSAPKVFQAVCRDNIFPYIGFFGKGYGKGQEPWRGYILTFFIAAGCVCIGDLNEIAPLISNFFLASYGLINYSCFDASFAKSPGWRPAFKYYSMWLSLFGAVLCVVVMFLMDWIYALATIALVLVLYMYVYYRKQDINWGSSSQAHVYRRALNNTLHLNHISDHVKNYRPQLLVLTAFPSARPLLVDLCANVTGRTCLMICGHVILAPTGPKLFEIHKLSGVANNWLRQRRVKSFYSSIAAPTLRAGVQNMMQTVGVGKVRPNILMIGFKAKWKTATPEEVNDYFNVIHDAFDLNYGVGIIRVREGLDFSDLSPVEVPVGDKHSRHRARSCQLSVAPVLHSSTYGRGRSDSTSKEDVSAFHGDNTSKTTNSSHDDDDEHAQVTVFGQLGVPDKIKPLESSVEMEKNIISSSTSDSASIDSDFILELSRFNRKKQHGNIDVWWLFDDGGLTMLIPHLLATKKRWKGCSLRVFMNGTDKELEGKHSHMAMLLRQFRIEFSMMKVITTLERQPRAESVEEFDRLIKNWVLKSDETANTHPWKITPEELLSQKGKTNRQIRLRELLQEHSMGSTLTVVTLPIPRKGECSAGLYMAWVDTITHNMPPIMLLRGNQESVLTYYS